MNKRVFYFNVTYSCNNNCIFCYSHNTKLTTKPHNEISIVVFKEYLEHNFVNSEDRVVLNGGEPLFHSRINEILEILKSVGCEVVVFTNGRLLNCIDYSILNANFRFVIPIHGFESLHDEITRVNGSYAETISSMKHLAESSNGCLIDLKIILNYGITANYESFEKCLCTFSEVPFNNAVHITKMADTLVSKKNGCISLSNQIVSYYTRILLEYFFKYSGPVKIHDTCLKTIDLFKSSHVEKYPHSIDMKAKDFHKEEIVKLNNNSRDCYEKCSNKQYCLSSVTEYKVLEFFGSRIYENME